MMPSDMLELNGIEREYGVVDRLVLVDKTGIHHYYPYPSPYSMRTINDIPVVGNTMLTLGCPATIVQGLSPVDLLITDELGQKTGFTPGGTVLEIPNAYYSGSEFEHEFIIIENPDAGSQFDLDVTGTGSGTYGLMRAYLKNNGFLVESALDENLSTEVGQLDEYVILTPVPILSTFLSVASHDGWILESTETSNTGGKLNKNSATLQVGDDVANKQYRSILSFDTSTLPEDAVITSVTLKFKYAGKTGTLPFSTHGNLLVDVRKGAFSNNSALQLGDLNVKGTLTTYKAKVLTYANSVVDNWYSQLLLPADYQFMNLGGVTQFRLRFTKDDNNDFGADSLKIFSGDALLEADRPRLIIEYYIP
jgi:hypothetical protein